MLQTKNNLFAQRTDPLASFSPPKKKLSNIFLPPGQKVRRQKPSRTDTETHLVAPKGLEKPCLPSTIHLLEDYGKIVNSLLLMVKPPFMNQLLLDSYQPSMIPSQSSIDHHFEFKLYYCFAIGFLFMVKCMPPIFFTIVFPLLYYH